MERGLRRPFKVRSRSIIKQQHLLLRLRGLLKVQVNDFDVLRNRQPILQTIVMEVQGVAVAAEPRGAVRSCTTCSKAKAKCVRQDAQQLCERFVVPRVWFGWRQADSMKLCEAWEGVPLA